MRRRTATILAVLVCMFAHASYTHAQQQPTTNFNFQDADLAYVLSALAQSAGIGFSYADLPVKPITLRAALTRPEMLSLIRSLAEANGVSVIQTEALMRLQGSAMEQEDPRQLYIHRLRHARAAVLSQTLQALFSGGGVIGRVNTSGSQTLTQQLRQLNQQQAPQGPVQFVVGGGGGEFGVVIVPDDATNALLVRASPADWQAMEQAIQALDTRPLQVVIEVVIAEVRLNNDTNVGVSVSAAGSSGDNTTIGNLPQGVRDTDNDFTLSVVHRGNIDIEATLSALSASGRVQILSRPVILAQNNMEARISVGTERPFIQSSLSGTNDPLFRESVSYRDVATVLMITPTINEDGYVNMAVTQEINSATNEVQFGAPVISTREAVTQLLARDGQTVVIGGLIDQQTDRSRSGIPYLKDIPVLGALFGTTRETIGNSELFLFLTPHIVDSDEDADRVKDEIENNTDLLRPLTPIRPLIPPDTMSGAGRTGVIPPDTLPRR